MGEWVGNCGLVGNCGWGGQCSGKLDSKINCLILSLQNNSERRHFPKTGCNLHSEEVLFIVSISFFGLPSSASLPPSSPLSVAV